MTPEQLVHNTVKDRCLKAGCTAKVSQDAADATVKAYKENRFTTVPKLIDAAIVNAKKLIVKPSKNVKVK